MGRIVGSLHYAHRPQQSIVAASQDCISTGLGEGRDGLEHHWQWANVRYTSLQARTVLRAAPNELAFIGGFLPSNDARVHEKAMEHQRTSQALEASWAEGGTEAHD
jgi:hypothetical protein